MWPNKRYGVDARRAILVYASRLTPWRKDLRRTSPAQRTASDQLRGHGQPFSVVPLQRVAGGCAIWPLGPTPQRADRQAHHPSSKVGTVTSTARHFIAHLKAEDGADGKRFTAELLATITELSPTGV